MKRNPFDQERLAMVGVAFEAGCMYSQFGPAGRHEFRSRPTREERTIVHKVPNVPIMLDGVAAPPEKVKEFDGHPLYYVLDKQTAAEGSLQVFTTPQKARQYRDHINAKLGERASHERINVSLEAIAASRPPLDGAVVLYDDIEKAGSRWVFWADWLPVIDFTHVYCTLWWCTDINDKVSSLETNIWLNVPEWHWPVYTTLCEHVNYQGSELSIENPATIPDLGIYGWNDRASSMYFLSINL